MHIPVHLAQVITLHEEKAQRTREQLRKMEESLDREIQDKIFNSPLFPDKAKAYLATCLETMNERFLPSLNALTTPETFGCKRVTESELIYLDSLAHIQIPKDIKGSPSVFVRNVPHAEEEADVFLGKEEHADYLQTVFPHFEKETENMAKVLGSINTSSDKISSSENDSFLFATLHLSEMLDNELIDYEKEEEDFSINNAFTDALKNTGKSLSESLSLFIKCEYHIAASHAAALLDYWKKAHDSYLERKSHLNGKNLLDDTKMYLAYLYMEYQKRVSQQFPSLFEPMKVRVDNNDQIYYMHPDGLHYFHNGKHRKFAIRFVKRSLAWLAGLCLRGIFAYKLAPDGTTLWDFPALATGTDAIQAYADGLPAMIEKLKNRGINLQESLARETVSQVAQDIQKANQALIDADILRVASQEFTAASTQADAFGKTAELITQQNYTLLFNNTLGCLTQFAALEPHFLGRTNSSLPFSKPEFWKWFNSGGFSAATGSVLEQGWKKAVEDYLVTMILPAQLQYPSGLQMIDAMGRSYIDGKIANNAVLQQFLTLSTGSAGTFQNVAKAVKEGMALVVPNDVLMDKFVNIVPELTENDALRDEVVLGLPQFFNRAGEFIQSISQATAHAPETPVNIVNLEKFVKSPAVIKTFSDLDANATGFIKILEGFVPSSKNTSIIEQQALGNITTCVNAVKTNLAETKTLLNKDIPELITTMRTKGDIIVTALENVKRYWVSKADVIAGEDILKQEALERVKKEVPNMVGDLYRNTLKTLEHLKSISGLGNGNYSEARTITDTFRIDPEALSTSGLNNASSIVGVTDCYNNIKVCINYYAGHLGNIIRAHTKFGLINNAFRHMWTYYPGDMGQSAIDILRNMHAKNDSGIMRWLESFGYANVMSLLHNDKGAPPPSNQRSDDFLSPVERESIRQARNSASNLKTPKLPLEEKKEWSFLGMTFATSSHLWQTSRIFGAYQMLFSSMYTVMIHPIIYTASHALAAYRGIDGVLPAEASAWLASWAPSMGLGTGIFLGAVGVAWVLWQSSKRRLELKKPGFYTLPAYFINTAMWISAIAGTAILYTSGTAVTSLYMFYYAMVFMTANISSTRITLQEQLNCMTAVLSKGFVLTGVFNLVLYYYSPVFGTSTAPLDLWSDIGVPYVLASLATLGTHVTLDLGRNLMSKFLEFYMHKT